MYWSHEEEKVVKENAKYTSLDDWIDGDTIRD